MSQNPTALLRRLGLSETEVQLYLELLKHGALTAHELTKLTHGKRPTVYYALRQLAERGLIHKSGVPGVEHFQPESPQKLLTLVTLQSTELEQLEKDVQEVIPQLSQAKTPYEGLPAVSFYEGDVAMKQIISETLYARKPHIDSIAPADNFFFQIGQTFADNYVKERTMRGFTTRHLWEKPLRPDLIKNYGPRSQMKIIPKNMHGRFKTTVFLYDDKVMYISSRKNGYVLLVKSKEHFELMRAIYDELWDISKALSARSIQ